MVASLTGPNPTNLREFMTSGLRRNFALAILASVVLLTAASARKTESFHGQEAAANEVLVKFKSGTPLLGIAQALDAQEFKHQMRGLYHVVSRSDGVGKLVEELRNRPDVLYAEPNYIRHIDSTTPNDQLFQTLWGL